jgi:hypothetical protein
MCDVLLTPGVNRVCAVLLPPGVNRVCAVLLPPGVNPIAVKYVHQIPCGNTIEKVRIQGSQIHSLLDLSATSRHATYSTPQEGVGRPQCIVSILLGHSHSVFLSFERLLMCNKTELIDINYSPDVYLRRQTPPPCFFLRRGSHQPVVGGGRWGVWSTLPYRKYTHTVTQIGK